MSRPSTSILREFKAATLRSVWVSALRYARSLIDDAPIWAKASAASAILLLCLVAIGSNAFLALNQSSTDLLRHAQVELPKQNTVAELTSDIVAAHLKMFRFVTWTQIGIGADSQELLSELETLGARLQALGRLSNLSAAETKCIAELGLQWDKYVREIRDVLAAATADSLMASMLLTATDDEFRNLATELQKISALVTAATTVRGQQFAVEAKSKRDMIALVGSGGVLIAVVVLLLVGRSIVGPIRAITRSMGEVSAAGVSVTADYRNRKDEIGHMVRAIDLFQQTLREKNQDLARGQDELRSQNLRFDAALQHMSQGLTMFDAEQRLLVCNQLFADLYGLTPEQVKPGTSARQIMEHCYAKGVFGRTDVESFMRDWLDAFAKASSQIQELADGRVFSIQRRRMPDGGLVSTTEDITERRHAEAKITHMALHDVLTGLGNRTLLNERLQLALAGANRGGMLAAHIIDLDHFKRVNDTLGHSAGDVLLKMVTERLRALVRETDTIARMGGDEFAIVQGGISQPADATSLAQCVIEELSRPYKIDNNIVVIGTSVGIAVGPSDGDSPEQLMRNADLALYRAKGDGRGTFRFFEPAMDAQMQARRTLECELRNALGAGEFELHYQPVVELNTNKIIGFEALIRWPHPQMGMIPPSTFIPLAEEIGLIIPIGEWAIREACATAATWPGDLRIAVNLSPAQFRDPRLVETIVSALATFGLAPDRLELEITETILLHDSEATLGMLYQLRELGVRVAMDDFGTGYSSLSYLQSFPFDKIKIDRSFVKDVADSSGSLNIVRAIAALAQGLGMATTAEGVETSQQLAMIRLEGCTEMQGFIFSEPVPAHEIEGLIANRADGKAQVESTAA